MKNNFRLLVVAFGIISVTPSIAQKDNVGIGTSKPDQSAVLDISSSSKGVLMPRMSLQQRNSIQSPAKGLIVYQTDMLSGFYFFDGNEWKPIASENKANSIAADPNDWTKTGNAGTNPTTNFVGTTDNQPLIFRTSNVRSGFIDKAFGGTFSVFFGPSAGIASTGNANVGIGANSLKANTTGYSNMGVGAYSLEKNIDGFFNTAVGSNAIGNNTSGDNNLGLGAASLRLLATGNNNTAIGVYSGFNALGSGNMFLGYQAGYNETGSNMLYLANSNTANPLMKGNFDTDWLRINVGSATGTANTAATASYVAIGNFDPATPMAIPTGYRLVVEQGILTEKIKVALKSTTVGGDWSDYVFEDSYKLLPLEKVEKFIKDNKHLPNVPSAEEMLSNGNDLIKTDAKLLEKIEELTLYMIELNKEIKALKFENEKLKNK